MTTQTNSNSPMKFKQSFIAIACAGLWLSILQTVFVHAVPVGPQMKPIASALEEIVEPEKGFLKDRMNIPSLRLAIPVLNPGIPQSTKKQEEEGVWPELRKVEAVRSALKLKEWLYRYNQFDSILVSADASISADIYLIARIIRSTGEIMELAYQVVDARGEVWSAEQKQVHRVEPGWHERYGETSRDPFDPLYQAVANEVYELLKDKGKAHVNQLERNKRSANSAKLSELQKITKTRDLAFAGFMLPSEYGQYLEQKERRWSITQLPDEQSEVWGRIQSVMLREDAFVQVVEDHYQEFAASIEVDYQQWQEDMFPIAREARLAKRGRTWKAIAGTALVAASAASAKDGAADEGDRSAQNAAVAGALAGGGLIAMAFRDNHLNQRAVGEINELGKSFNDSIRPTSIDVNGKIVTLTGSVHNQFAMWRSMLADIYAAETAEDGSVVIVDEE